MPTTRLQKPTACIRRSRSTAGNSWVSSERRSLSAATVSCAKCLPKSGSTGTPTRSSKPCDISAEATRGKAPLVQSESHAQAHLLQRLPYELRGPSVARPVGAPGRSDDAVHGSEHVGGVGAAARARAFRRAVSGRRDRTLRCLSRQRRSGAEAGGADAGQRSDAVDTGDG